MALLIEHIGVLEQTLAQMTGDGHHADPAVDAAMQQIDAAVTCLHGVVRHQRSEDRHQRSEDRGQIEN